MVLSVAQQLAAALEQSSAAAHDDDGDHGPGLTAEGVRAVELARQDALFDFLRRGLGVHRAPLRRVFARSPLLLPCYGVPAVLLLRCCSYSTSAIAARSLSVCCSPSMYRNPDRSPDPPIPRMCGWRWFLVSTRIHLQEYYSAFGGGAGAAELMEPAKFLKFVRDAGLLAPGAEGGAAALNPWDADLVFIKAAASAAPARGTCSLQTEGTRMRALCPRVPPVHVRRGQATGC